MRIHYILYTFLLCIIGMSASLMYGMTHDFLGLRIVQVVIDSPAKSNVHTANATDIFSPVE